MTAQGVGFGDRGRPLFFSSVATLRQCKPTCVIQTTKPILIRDSIPCQVLVLNTFIHFNSELPPVVLRLQWLMQYPLQGTPTARSARKTSNLSPGNW